MACSPSQSCSRYTRLSAEQASTQDVLPESSSCRNASRRLFSQSRRSLSVRATPRCILSLLALEWKSSASRNLRPNLLATSRPTSDLPEPDTPVKTIARAFPGDEPIAVILELILGELGSAIAESIFSANVCSWREGKRGNAAAVKTLAEADARRKTNNLIHRRNRQRPCYR